jgi:hypothetical protein
MKNVFMIVFYVLCIVGLSVEIVNSVVSNVRIYQVILVLTSFFLLFFKVKTVLNEKNK